MTKTLDRRGFLKTAALAGATVTANAARTALADCMSQASGTTVTVKLEVEGAKIEEDLETVVSQEVVKAEAIVLGCGARHRLHERHRVGRRHGAISQGLRRVIVHS